MIALRDKSLPWSENLRQYHVSEDEEGVAVHLVLQDWAPRAQVPLWKERGINPRIRAKTPLKFVWH